MITDWLYLPVEVRGSSSKYISLGPFTETKHNFMEIFIATDTANVFQHIRHWN
jgi:hypothetical protein